MDLLDFFERVAVINLDRRPDRWDSLLAHLSNVDWPFSQPIRFRAIDGRLAKPPSSWGAGSAAWGCHQSHVRILEDALHDGVESVLIMEDDVRFEQGFRERLETFLAALPDDWQQVYLGGQHLFEKSHPPASINDHVVRPYNVNRTHAYAVHRRGLVPIYRWLTDYVTHAQHPGHHVDHRLGALHETGRIKVYAPKQWIVGQSDGKSDVSGKSMPMRFWVNDGRSSRSSLFVPVIGLHRSGSSCLAGALHKLGVHMGPNLEGFEPAGGFESGGLARICERAYPFPSTRRAVRHDATEGELSTHIRHVQDLASSLGQIAGGKYPTLCALGDELASVCGADLRVIHINRPLSESIASLKSRSRKCRGWLRISNADAEWLQKWLWDAKLRFLSAVDHLTVEYADLLSNPRGEVARLTNYLEISPTEAQLVAAHNHVQARLRKHVDPVNFLP